MKLWLVSFLILFFGAEGLQWFAQLHWFSGVELSLPTVVMGGIGLAIASNYRLLQTLGLLPDLRPNQPPAPPATEQAPASIKPASPPSAPPPALEPRAPRQDKSISFEIHKPKPISFTIPPARRTKR